MSKRLLCVILSICLFCSSVLLTVYAEDGTQTTGTAQIDDNSQPTTQPTETTQPSAETTQPTTEATVPEESIPVNETRLSAEGIALLKQFEGYRAYPYWDVSQWSVGYGTKCPDDKLEQWKENGITEREAEGLLFTYVNKFGLSLQWFVETFHLDLNQHQYDALMLFTYNVGSGWMREDGLLRSAVISGATGNDFIYPFVLWCKADKVSSDGLIKRRLAEANLYLNGEYNRNPPSDYRFVRFDENGGEVDYHVQGYDVDAPVSIKVIAETTYTASNGAVYAFEGWYTSRTGGTKVEQLDSSLGDGVKLYAHWKLIKEGNGPAQDNELGGTSTLVDVVVTTENLNVRLGPGTGYGYAPVRSYPKGTQLTIIATKQAGGYLWGKIENTGDPGHWVALEYTNYYQVIQEQGSTTPPATVPPTTQAPTQPSTQAPTKAPTQAPTQPTVQHPEILQGSWSGVIKTAGSQLRVRSEANLNAKVVTFLDNGTTVEITARVEIDGMEWGYMGKGWISLKYVDFTAAEPVPPTTESQTQAPTQLPTQAPTQPSVTVPEETEPVETVPPTVSPQAPALPDGAGYWIGTVQTHVLKIRDGLGNYYRITGYYRQGESLEVTRCQTVDGQLWGLTDLGWVVLTGVNLDGEITSGGEGYYTVKTCSLRVRSDAGIFNRIVDFYYYGDRIAIYQQQMIGSSLWGLTDLGWVDMKCLQ